MENVTTGFFYDYRKSSTFTSGSMEALSSTHSSFDSQSQSQSAASSSAVDSRRQSAQSRRESAEKMIVSLVATKYYL